MIKKYTFLISVFIFMGIHGIFAMSVTSDVFSETAGQTINSSFFGEDNLFGFENQMSGYSIDEQAVWAANGSIYVRVKENTEVNIYTITGQLTKRIKVTAGETAIPMSKGLYIVRLGDITRKVIVR